ncbi:MAG: hypothetical protein ACYTGN_10325 [Planctomycetota bacterium]
MRKLFILLVFAAVAVPTCGSDSPVTAEGPDPRLLAEEMREGCVAANLSHMLGIAERLAPLCEVRSVEELVARAGPDCQLHLAVPFNMDCGDVLVADERMFVHASLLYVAANGELVGNPGDAAHMKLQFEAVGDDFTTEGLVECRSDPSAGLVLTGTVTTRFANGCEVVSDFGDVTAQRLADQDGEHLVYTSGSVDIEVTDATGAHGSAALIGRRAVVALDVSGTVTHGEVLLD